MLAAGVALFALLVTLVANLLGLTGFTVAEETATRVRATVSAAAPCVGPGAGGERVRFGEGGAEREVRFDGCGHSEGEQVEISVPDGATGDDLTVQAARTAVDGGDSGGPLGPVLLFVAAGAGGACAYWWRRGQATSSGGDSQVLH